LEAAESPRKRNNSYVTRNSNYNDIEETKRRFGLKKNNNIASERGKMDDASRKRFGFKIKECKLYMDAPLTARDRIKPLDNTEPLKRGKELKEKLFKGGTTIKPITMRDRTPPPNLNAIKGHRKNKISISSLRS